MEGKRLFSLGLIVLSFLMALFFYFQVPGPLVAVHWGLDGQVNGYTSKIWGIVLFPVLISIFYLFYLLIPRLDPLRGNIEKFRDQYEGLGVVMVLFAVYLYFLMMIWNWGVRFDMVRFLVPAMAMLIFYCGVVMRHAKRNWIFGIRTPWTLSSDEVWAETHRVGSFLFKASAIISLIGVLGIDHAYIYICLLGPILFSAVSVVTYSYWVYSKTR